MIRKNLSKLLNLTHRHVNIFFLFFLITVFIVAGDATDHIRIGIALILAVIFGITAFLLNWLTYDGAQSAGIFGTIAYGIGNWPVALTVLFFFISGSLVSKDVAATENSFAIKFRRDGKQVWANGFWLCLWVLIWFVSGVQAFMFAAVASIATATADTWATELGSKSKNKTYLITDFSKTSAGTDGGVSFQGSIAALIGSLLIGIILWLSLNEVKLVNLIVISSAGFLGCFVDSFLGAKLQGKSFRAWILSNNENGTLTVSNNIVNWLSTGTASLIVLTITLII